MHLTQTARNCHSCLNNLIKCGLYCLYLVRMQLTPNWKGFIKKIWQFLAKWFTTDRLSRSYHILIEGTHSFRERISFLYARLKNGTYYAVAMSVRPSVRLSVRPSVRVFRTFLQHALRYQFETWYMHSVGGTTCRVWVASQLGQFDLVYSQK